MRRVGWDSIRIVADCIDDLRQGTGVRQHLAAVEAGWRLRQEAAKKLADILGLVQSDGPVDVTVDFDPEHVIEAAFVLDLPIVLEPTDQRCVEGVLIDRVSIWL